LKLSLKEISLSVNGSVFGDSNIEIFEVAEIQNAKNGSITFLANSMYAKYLDKTEASAIIVSDENLISGRNGIIVDNPQLAIAKVLSLFFPDEPPTQKIHSKSFVSTSAEIGNNVTIEVGAVIENGVKIGDNSFIGANSFIGRNTKIGSDCKIYQNAVLYYSTIIGNNSVIHSSTVIGCDGFGFVPGVGQHYKIPQTGKVVIGDDVEIGANSVIDRATIGETIIGDMSKLDNLVHIGHNVQIGKACLITAQVGIAGSTKIGDNCQIGGQAGVVPHVEIGPNSIIAAKSGVTKSLAGNQMYGGYPARPIREEHKRNAVHREVLSIKKKLNYLIQNSNNNQ
jgi:UDP-3-O-[3-hydroxymyristoyl] glucosamine N-acyltransferase